MSMSKRIRELRYVKGWGPDELASRAKISRTALYQIERGNTTRPQAGTLKNICRALGVPPESLFDSPAAAAIESPAVTVPEDPPASHPAVAGAQTPASPTANPRALVPAFRAAQSPAATPVHDRQAVKPRRTSSDRADELMEKFRLLLASPLAEGIARIIEESYRLLPIIPAHTTAEAPWYQSSDEIDRARQSRDRSRENG